jgi:hypothetical protein
LIFYALASAVYKNLTVNLVGIEGIEPPKGVFTEPPRTYRYTQITEWYVFFN